VLQQQVPWQVALGIVFWGGVLFLIVSITPIREQIAMAIPPGLRIATAAGIGLLLTLIGLRNAGLVESDPVTLLRLGTLDHRAALLLAGILIAVALMRRQNPLAFLASIFAVTAAAWMLGYATPPDGIVSAPDFSSVFLKLDVLGALRLALLPAIVTILVTDLFDSLSTFIGVAGVSVAHLVPRHHNLLVTRTLSKAHSLAGFRVGYAVLPEALADDLNANNDAYPLARPSQAAALATLQHEDKIRARIAELRAWTGELAAELRALGVRTFSSETYFFLADFAPRDAGELAVQLKARGIMVKPLANRRLGPGYMRVTTSLPADNARFLVALRDLL